MQLRHIFVGIDLGDKNSVARMAVERQASERLGFVNNRAGRKRLFQEVRRRAEKAGEAKIIMAYEASSCGFVLRDEAEARGGRQGRSLVAPSRGRKSGPEQRRTGPQKSRLQSAAAAAAPA